MPRITVSGPEPVASLLHAVADGISRGRVALGDQAYECSPAISAVVESPGPGTAAEVVTVSLRFAAVPRHPRPLEVEQEMTHPGG